ERRHRAPRRLVERVDQAHGRGRSLLPPEEASDHGLAGRGGGTEHLPRHGGRGRLRHDRDHSSPRVAAEPLERLERGEAARRFGPRSSESGTWWLKRKTWSPAERAA